MAQRILTDRAALGRRMGPINYRDHRDIYIPLLVGYPIDPDAVRRLPNPIIVSKPKHGDVLNLFAEFSATPWFIDSAVKGAIEELEPSANSFIPVKIQVEGDSTTHQYFMFVIHQAIDAVLIDETDFGGGHGRKGYEKSAAISSFGDCVLDGRPIAGRHIWRGSIRPKGGRSPFSDDYFCSDELAQRLKALKIENLDFLSCIVK